MAAEFTCCECGRHLMVLTSDKAPEFKLCFLCLEMPGWFRIPQMRAALCADHDGVEVWEIDAPSIILIRPND